MEPYHFDLHDCHGSVIRVASNREAADLAQARMLAIGEARRVMAEEIVHGRLCLSCWIVVSDRNGHLAFTLHFGEAVEFTPHAACAADLPQRA